MTKQLTTLPDVFTFRSAGRSGSMYRMTKMADGDYACTQHNEEFKNDGGSIARHDLRGTLQRINEGTWTFFEDITPVAKLPRKFTVIATPQFFPTEFDVDLDAETVTCVRNGNVYPNYTEAMAEKFLAEGNWVVTKSKAERDAEAKAIADAEAAEKEARKDVAIEAAKKLSAALTAYNEAAAELAAAVAAL